MGKIAHKLSRFKWDYNDQYVLLQEQLAAELVEEMYISVRDNYLNAVDLTGVETVLSRGIARIKGEDLLELFFIYDTIAASYRQNYRESEGQLSLFWEKEYVKEWRLFWVNEVADLTFNNDFSRAILECLIYKNEATADLAKESLIQILENRYDIDWYYTREHEQEIIRGDLFREKDPGFHLESVERLYGKNPFRIFGLFVNSESATTQKVYQRFFNRAKVGRNINVQGVHILGQLDCNSELIRNAYNALTCLEERLRFRLFWFGSGNQTKQAYADMMSGLEEGFCEQWIDRAYEKDYFAAQLIAICKHLTCIREDSMAFGNSKNVWLDTFSTWWGNLLHDQDFWIHYENMERQSGWLPQATTDDIDKVKENCWSDILSVNVELATKYWQKNQYAAVNKHLELIRGSGFPQNAVEKAESEVILFVENEIKVACREFISLLERNLKDITDLEKIGGSCSEHRQKLLGYLLPLAVEINNMEFDSYLTQCIRVKVSNVIRKLAVVYYNNKLRDYTEAEELIWLALSLLDEDDPEYYQIREDAKIISSNAGNAGYAPRILPKETGKSADDEFTDTIEDSGGEILLEAARDGNLDGVIALLKSGVDVNFVNKDGVTALMSAAYKGHAVVAGVLVNAGAAVDLQDKSDFGSGFTALMWAANEGHDEIVSLLLKAGADFNLQTVSGYTALMLTAEQGHYRVILQLLDYEANVFMTNNDGETALSLARKMEEDKIVDLLKPFYEQVGWSVNEKGDTLLMHAAYNNLGSLAKELLDSGSKIDCTNKEGKTALIYAAFSGNLEIVRMLIDHGADIWIKDNEKKTAYDWAVCAGEAESAKLIKRRSGIRGIFL